MSRTNDRWLVGLGGDGAQRESALRDLRQALLRNLCKALSKRTADDALLEDAVQDALMRVLGRLDQFQGRSQFLTWATSIAIRVALDELRKRRWKDVSLDAMMTGADFVPQHAIDLESAPEVQAQRRAILDAMQRVIKLHLTDKQRIALLAELKGMPQDEIARQLGSNRNAVYKLTHDARKKLKKGLESAGYGADDVVALTAN